MEKGEWDYKELSKLQKLSWGDSLGLALFVSSIPFRAVGWSVQHLRNPLNASYTEHIWAHVLKAGFSNLSFEQIHALLPVVPMRAMLNSRISKQLAGSDLNNYNKMLPVEGASARWIHEVENRTPEDPVIYFLHGGAYFLKMLPMQILWLSYVARKLRQCRISVVALDYTVTPYARYPTQLEEAIAGYKALSESCNRVIVCGDSAGGNLSAALLASLHHGKIPGPWGVISISGWYTMSSEMPLTGTRTQIADYIEIENTHRASLAYATAEQIASDPLVNMTIAKKGYWKGIYPARSIAVWGEKESLRNSNIRFVAEAEIPFTFEEPLGLHDVTVTGPGSPATKYILQTLKSWLTEAKL